MIGKKRMALIICPACKKKISELAEQCPHCGKRMRITPEHKMQEIMSILVLILLLIIFIVWLFDTPSKVDISLEKAREQKSNSITIEESTINRLKSSQRSKWEHENWYRAKDGDWFGNYLNWFRHTMVISSDNAIGVLFGNLLYPSLVLESYKKELNKEDKIERILHLTILANKRSVNSISIQFDNGKWEQFNTITKHKIEVHFLKKDIDTIINKLKNSEIFAIKVFTNTLYFNNNNFKKYLE